LQLDENFRRDAIFIFIPRCDLNTEQEQLNRLLCVCCAYAVYGQSLSWKKLADLITNTLLGAQFEALMLQSARQCLTFAYILCAVNWQPPEYTRLEGKAAT
jgi:hypothetical protein